MPVYTESIDIDGERFVRISGVCVGRLVTDDGVLFFEVKDRNRNRSYARGGDLVRVPVGKLVRHLQNQ